MTLIDSARKWLSQNVESMRYFIVPTNIVVAHCDGWVDPLEKQTRLNRKVVSKLSYMGFA